MGFQVFKDVALNKGSPEAGFRDVALNGGGWGGWFQGCSLEFGRLFQGCSLEWGVSDVLFSRV
jgi:hypothetical protein